MHEHIVNLQRYRATSGALNQGSNFIGGSFSSRDNVRAPIQIRRASSPQHFKR